MRVPCSSLISLLVAGQHPASGFVTVNHKHSSSFRRVQLQADVSPAAADGDMFYAEGEETVASSPSPVEVPVPVEQLQPPPVQMYEPAVVSTSMEQTPPTVVATPPPTQVRNQTVKAGIPGGIHQDWNRNVQMPYSTSKAIGQKQVQSVKQSLIGGIPGSINAVGTQVANKPARVGARNKPLNKPPAPKKNLGIPGANHQKWDTLESSPFPTTSSRALTSSQRRSATESLAPGIPRQD